MSRSCNLRPFEPGRLFASFHDELAASKAVPKSEVNYSDGDGSSFASSTASFTTI